MDVHSVLFKHLPQIYETYGAVQESIRIKVIDGGQYPEEYINLRREVYSEETKWLSSQELFDANDDAGRHILIYDSITSELMASIVSSPADGGDYYLHAKLPREEFSDAIFSTRIQVSPRHRQKGILKLIIYLSMREGRLMGKKRYVGYVEPGDIPTWRVLRYEALEGAAVRGVKGADGHQYNVVPIESTLDEGCMRSFQLLPNELQEWVVRNCFVEEIAQTVLNRVNDFYRIEYFNQIRNHTLTRSNYLSSLKNQYQYVKWTTKILGRAVGMTDDAELREHYVSHLKGEVNHEKWLENDMEYLGSDFPYVRDHLVPDVGIMNFMFIQEALASSRQDPILFLGVPVAIEAISGFLDERFIKDLKACIRNWGYDEPSKGCSFLSSHIHTDGAVDGHWINTLRSLGKYLKTEKQLQETLRVVHLVMNALEQSYSGFTGTKTSTITLQ